MGQRAGSEWTLLLHQYKILKRNGRGQTRKYLTTSEVADLLAIRNAGTITLPRGYPDAELWQSS